MSKGYREFYSYDFNSGEIIEKYGRSSTQGLPRIKNKGYKALYEHNPMIKDFNINDLIINNRIYPKFDNKVTVDKVEIVTGEYIHIHNITNPSVIYVCMGKYRYRMNFKKKKQIGLCFNDIGTYLLKFNGPIEKDYEVQIIVTPNIDNKAFSSDIEDSVQLSIPDKIMDMIKMDNDNIINNINGKSLNEISDIITPMGYDELKDFIIKMARKINW